jgi:hypothetical protein
MRLTPESAAAIMTDHFKWLCESPFLATRRVYGIERRISGDFEIGIDFTNASTSLKLSIAGFQMEFGLHVSSVEVPRPNEWGSSLCDPEWPEFEGVELDSGLDVRTEEHLQRLCKPLSSLCRRYPEYFLPGSFLLIQNKMLKMFDAREEE